MNKTKKAGSNPDGISNANITADKVEKAITELSSENKKNFVQTIDAGVNIEGINFKQTLNRIGFDVVLPHIEAGIFLPFQDGMIGAGIFGEMESLYNSGKKIWQINHDKQISRVFNLDLTKKLSIEDTRKRVY